MARLANEDTTGLSTTVRETLDVLPLRNKQLAAVLSIEPQGDPGDVEFSIIDQRFGWNDAIEAVRKAIEEAGR